MTLMGGQVAGLEISSSCYPLPRMSGLFEAAGEDLPDLEVVDPVWTAPTTKEQSGRGDQGGAEMQIIRSYRESRHLFVAGLMEKPGHFDLFFSCISDSGIIA